MRSFKKLAISNYCAFYAVIVFLSSLFFLSLYLNGDQAYYIRFWNSGKLLDFIDLYNELKITLGSYEPTYFLIVFLVSPFISKLVFISLLNGMFAFLMLEKLIKGKVHVLILFILSLNFYLLVLYFSAERLKIAILILLISEKYSHRVPFYFLSTLAHVSTIYIIICKYILIFSKNFKKFKLVIASKFNEANKILLLSVVLISSYLSYAQINQKAIFYISYVSFSFYALVKLIALTFLAVIYSKNKITPLILFVPLIIIFLLLGTERFTMFAFGIFMYFGLRFNRGLNVGVLATNVYLAIKGYFYLFSIYKYGNGFYENKPFLNLW